jgi:hypothetical protein
LKPVPALAINCAMGDQSDFAGRDRAALRKHLTSYWRMEAGNVLIMPIFGAIVLNQFDDAPNRATWLAIAACCLLLVIGAAAWKLALARLDGEDRLAEQLTAACARAQWPSLALVIVASAATVLDVTQRGWPPHTIAAVGFTLLGWLEYVNYYHVQLQNFDSTIDFKRLLSGRGLRRAHLGRAVRKWRAERGRARG